MSLFARRKEVRRPDARCSEDVAQCAAELLRWASAREFEGIDPYDALNSPFASVLTLNTRPGRIALTQFLRRSPINLRPLLRISPGANPKALGLFLEGVVALERTFCAGGVSDLSTDLRTTARTLTAKLLELRSEGTSGAAWGYNFPWQNRFQLLPSGTPTIVNTSFIANALLDYAELTGDQQALDVALTAPEFVLNDLNRLCSAEDELCFSYTPRDENYVHNANMLGAALLARIAVRHGRSELLDPALTALRYSMRRQRDDGSWFYAERREQRWIDSFHTGFNLEALRTFIRLGLAKEYEEGFRKGADFYATRFFRPGEPPWYYADRPYLVDVHAPAEGVCFFSDDPARRDLATQILQWTFDNMRDPHSGLFFFRRSKWFAIRIPYMRWSQAWAFRALARLLSSPV